MCMQVKKQQVEPNMEQWTGSKLGKEYVKAIYMFSPCLFNFYTEHLMQNAKLDESQDGIKIGGTNINNLKNTDDITLKAESEEELKRLFMKVKRGEWKTGLKLNIQKTKIMASGPITSWQTEAGKTSSSDRFYYFLELQHHYGRCLQPQNWDTCSLEGKLESLFSLQSHFSTPVAVLC